MEDEIMRSSDRVDLVVGDIDQRKKNKLKTGIAFIDDAMGGLVDEDLVLVGAASGVGKTDLCTLIALNASAQDKGVFFFCLEASQNEIESRIIYKKAVDMFYKDPDRPNIRPSYDSFMDGSLSSKFLIYLEKAVTDQKKDLVQLRTIYKNFDGYDISTFKRHVEVVKKYADLLIVDHLQYFDTPGKNENLEMTQIMKEIRGVSLKTGIPIILVSHLRKRDKRNDGVVPDVDSFIGTSNLVKIATKILVVVPNYAQKKIDNQKWETFMRVCKNRYSQAKTRYVGKLIYDSTKGCYLPDYSLFVPHKGGFQLIELDKNQYPSWSRRSVYAKLGFS